VDTILKEADVARRSLYQHFGGKDGLIAEMLRTTASDARYRQVMDETDDASSPSSTSWRRSPQARRSAAAATRPPNSP
jgi:AcrR family transcriptional regulator